MAIAISTFTGDDFAPAGFRGCGRLALMTPDVTLTDSITGVPVTISAVWLRRLQRQQRCCKLDYEDEVSLPYPTMTRGPRYEPGGDQRSQGRPHRRAEGPVPACCWGPRQLGHRGRRGHVTQRARRLLNGRLAGYTRQSDDGWQKNSSRPVTNWAPRTCEPGD